VEHNDYGAYEITDDDIVRTEARRDEDIVRKINTNGKLDPEEEEEDKRGNREGGNRTKNCE
jgi:hypothetical protein